MKRAISIHELTVKKFKAIELPVVWAKLLGEPELNGVWIVWGNSGHGKSRFLMKLAKVLSHYGRVAYNSLEEGARLSLQQNIIASGITDKHNIIILERESLDELKIRLKKPKHPRIVIIDSLQYTNLTKQQYKELKENYPNVLFIFNSHAEGKEPAGAVAKFIRYDADQKIRVEGFKAFNASRSNNGDDSDYVIWPEGAKKYWLNVKV